MGGTEPNATELTDWNVEAQPFLKSILDGVAQPVWVVDHEGLIRFANPAALAALGYDDLAELEGKPSHETIHYKYPDGSHFPVEECPMLLPRTTGKTIHSDEDWFFRRDGTMFPVSYWSAPIETPQGRGAVVAFSDIEEQRKAEQALRERDIAEARASEARAAQRRTIEAADAARRQVTRDLHDGAQQQFVNVVINLQLAQQKWTSEPERARELLDAAAQQAKTGIDELRELSAGIHPTLAIEASAYFFVSEALTNVVKHAQATRASVRIAATGDRLMVEVSDDGVGGANPHTPGHGLAGLADRMAALDGALSVQSGAGIGTTLRAEIPLRGSDVLS
jgi:PAS domain S-box-containing protein